MLCQFALGLDQLQQLLQYSGGGDVHCNPELLISYYLME